MCPEHADGKVLFIWSGPSSSNTGYSQLSSCGHPATTDTLIIQTAAKSQPKINYSCLTEINFPYNGLSLMSML